MKFVPGPSSSSRGDHDPETGAPASANQGGAVRQGEPAKGGQHRGAWVRTRFVSQIKIFLHSEIKYIFTFF